MTLIYSGWLISPVTQWSAEPPGCDGGGRPTRQMVQKRMLESAVFHWWMRTPSLRHLLETIGVSQLKTSSGQRRSTRCRSRPLVSHSGNADIKDHIKPAKNVSQPLSLHAEKDFLKYIGGNLLGLKHTEQQQSAMFTFPAAGSFLPGLHVDFMSSGF